MVVDPGVRVRSAKCQGAGADFVSEPPCAPAFTAILDDTGEGRVQVIGAHCQIHGPEEHFATALDRAYCQTWRVVLADFEFAVAVNFDASCSPGGILLKLNGSSNSSGSSGAT